MSYRQFTDQMGRVISIIYPPLRIISLVPSQTELLFDLGLDKKIVGITKFCIHPLDKFKATAKIGGTKSLNIKKIRELEPDLIIGNKEENERVQIEELIGEFPVWMSDINVLEDALEMINKIGNLTGKSQEADLLSFAILNGFRTLKVAGGRKQKVAYFIWKDPYMIAGRDTFINDILNKAGFDNFTDLNRYPELRTDQIRESNPEVVFLSSEPYPFKDVHVQEMKAICPAAKVIVVDGEMFSWYGSRLIHTPSYLQTLADLIN
ncbi:MAG: ABC transporter substrate-binding protein [Phormidesmis sp. FL-bin-119]|nr:ABC transporter substrate-binding protein [Pedobacter sp.]